jgi:hypothetical protein
MDSRYATPLYEMFKRGEVAHDIRMLAAQGVLAPRALEQLALLVLLAPRALEQLALLVLLCGDADAGVQAAAHATMAKIPPDPLARFLGSRDVPDEIRTFFAARGIQATPVADDADDAPLVAEGDPSGPVRGETDDEEAAALLPEQESAQPRMATIQRLSLCTVTEKVKAAMRGTREERGILIRDPNKLVSIAVLSSPKVTEQEIENFVKMGSVSEDVLRVIATTRAWIKNYGVIRGLCFNPKTPVGLSLGFLKRLLERDIKQIITDRNLPDPVKMSARKIMQAGDSRRN